MSSPSLSTDAEAGAQSASEKAVISVLLIGPSFDILGGQAVQASRLMKVLSDVPGQKMTFFPINPRPPKPFLWVRKIPFLRTIVNVILYNARLIWTARKHDVLHIFSAGLNSYSLWTIPALLYGKMYSKKMIVNYRDGQAEEHITEWRSAVPTLRLADRIVTPSGFLVDVLRNTVSKRGRFPISSTRATSFTASAGNCGQCS